MCEQLGSGPQYGTKPGVPVISKAGEEDLHRYGAARDEAHVMLSCCDVVRSHFPTVVRRPLMQGLSVAESAPHLSWLYPPPSIYLLFTESCVLVIDISLGV